MTARSVVVSRPLRTSNAVGDWGDEIFHKIDQSLEESRSMTASVSNGSKYNHHTSTISDASSTYSTAQFGQRASGRQISIESKMHLQPRQSGGLDVPLDSEDSAFGRGSHRIASEGSMQDGVSVVGSNRNTKEYGDLYDSHWRPSGQVQAQGNQNLKPTDAVRDNRRTAQMDAKPQTIREVPGPLPSPSIGKAM